MTDTPRRWDRLTAESDPAFEAFAAYLDTGSLRDAYRQRSGKAQATAAPGTWTGWSAKYNWVSRRAAYVEWTVRECQDATQLGLVQIRRRFIDTANTLLDDGSVPAVRAASRVIVENFPPVARVADVSDGPDIEDLSYTGRILASAEEGFTGPQFHGRGNRRRYRQLSGKAQGRRRHINKPSNS